MVAELIALDEAFFLDVLDCELFVVDFCTTLEVIVLPSFWLLRLLLMLVPAWRESCPEAGTRPFLTLTSTRERGVTIGLRSMPDAAGFYLSVFIPLL